MMLVLLSPALGVVAAAIATWHALLAGSFWYMPLGLVLLLAVIAIVQSHKAFDLACLGLVITVVIIWFRLDSPQQDYLLDEVQALMPQTYLMGGVLFAMFATLMLVHMARRPNRL